MASAETYISIKRVQEFLLRPETKCQEKMNKDSKENKVHKDEKVIHGKTLIDSSKRQRKYSDTFEERDNLISYAQNSTGRRFQNTEATDIFIRFKNAKAVWEQSENELSNGLFNVNLEITPGLCAVVGQVGSGKSTLLNVILGELDVDSGSVMINGTISYASQEPWVDLNFLFFFFFSVFHFLIIKIY